MGYSKSSTKRGIYSKKCLYQKNKEISNSLMVQLKEQKSKNKSTSKLVQGQKNEKPREMGTFLDA
jgi:hypothetical protein